MQPRNQRPEAVEPWDTMACERAKVTVLGAVQGVGFRPFVYRLATQLSLNGWVLNSPQGVFIEVEGSPHGLRTFLVRLQKERPPLAIVQSLEVSFLDAAGYEVLKFASARKQGRKLRLFYRISPFARIVCEKFLIPPIGGIGTRSPTAQIAGRDSVLLNSCPTIARIRR